MSSSSREEPRDSVTLSSSGGSFWRRNAMSLAFFALLGLGIGLHQVGVAIHASHPIHPDASSISLEREMAQGQKCALGRAAPVQDPEQASRLARMASRLQPYEHRGAYQVHLSHNHEKNAAACANRSLFIERDLARVLDDDELLFVGGHEVGHVELRHHATKLSYFDQVGWVGRVPIMSAPFVAELEALGQKLEKQADCYGVAVLRAEGIPVEKAESALRKTIGDMPQGGDHPPLQERLESMRQCANGAG